MVKQRMMVLGAGAAGLAAARELLDHSMDVVLVDKEDRWGGRAAAYGCKATHRCTACGVCLLLDLLEDMEQREALAFYPRTELVGWKSRPEGGFTATLRDAAGKAWDEQVSALVVATGFTPFAARLLPDLGYGRLPGVLGADELEERLRIEGGLFLDGQRAKKIAFVQCAGSRHLLLGADYCSTVCCQYALRMALAMQQDFPDTEVTIFYMDLQAHARGFDEIVSAAEEQLRLLRGVPMHVERQEEGRLLVKYEDVEGARLQESPFDAVVISQGIRPGASTQQLALLLGVNRDEHGFFMRHGTTQQSSRPGVYVAGTAGGPGDIRQSIASGRACAAALMQRNEEVGA